MAEGVPTTSQELQAGDTFSGGYDDYKVVSYIEKGTYGSVYRVVDSHDVVYAIKFARRSSDTSLVEEGLFFEESGRCGLLAAIDEGLKSCRCFVVMELTSFDLHNIVVMQEDHVFTMRTMVFIMEETLQGLKFLHSCGYIHNDFKSCNVAVALQNTRSLKLIDFGHVSKYRDAIGRHVADEKPSKLVGTVFYASVHVQEFHKATRNDELETWWYSMADLHQTLPWGGQYNEEMLKQKKEVHRLAESTLVASYPRLFRDLLTVILSSQSFHSPYYEKLEKILKGAKTEYPTESLLDWEKAVGQLKYGEPGL